MKFNIKRDIIALIIITVSVIIACYYYIVLPPVVASHYNGSGFADIYSSKLKFILICLSFPIVIYALFTYFIYPKAIKKYYTTKLDIFFKLRDISVTFVAFIMTLLLSAGKNGAFPNNLLGIGVGLLIIIVGVYLPKIPYNYFFGIRNSWTLSSELVWNKTHKISGDSSILGGLLIILLILLKVRLGIIIIVVMAPLGLFSIFIYPFILTIKLNK